MSRRTWRNGQGSWSSAYSVAVVCMIYRVACPISTSLRSLYRALIMFMYIYIMKDLLYKVVYGALVFQTNFCYKSTR